MCTLNQKGENVMETGKDSLTLSTSMIGLFEGKNEDGDYVLNPVATLDDYNNNTLTGIKVGDQSYFKYLDQVFNFVINKSYVTDSSGIALDNLKTGDSITFHYEADIVEVRKNHVSFKEKYNKLCNIKIKDIRTYNLFDAVDRLVNLAYNENKMVRYKVFHKTPNDINKLNAVQSELIRSDLSPQACILYLVCLLQYKGEYLEKSDIKSLLPLWDDETIEKTIYELVELGYLLDDKIYDLIDDEYLPSYITNSHTWNYEHKESSI